jgi:3-methylcrotonyl-CoA carboxylase alpha subunit
MKAPDMATRTPRPFHTLLIANRGEIACRVAATARRLGLRTIAVHADGDEHAPHVAACDSAVRLGPAAVRDSYLRGDLIVAAALRSGAQAIHPGYGFLSENADFAQAVTDAGLIFVGPPATAIRAMGDKARAKALMAQAGVPLVPGYHGEAQDLPTLQREADAIGYPVLIKASAGGGGKGMRVVNQSADLPAALASCQREALSSFGDERVLLERYLDRPRHIEVQVFADEHGHVLHLAERDCSVQRRHQKVLEEAPAPGLDAATRVAMGQAAVAAARSVGYVGAGTVEFICDGPDGQARFHFMEMNTRLQVEHPVTEAITGLDLVAWQLKVAMGEPLPLTQDQVQTCGHAIEARLCAEQPLRQFLPATGTLRVCRLPAATAFTPGAVRLDMGVREGDAIGPHYDNLLGKLIAWGPDRETALQRLQQALSEVHILGVATNVAFLRQVLACDSFQQARLDTHLLTREAAAWQTPVPLPPHEVLTAAALACQAGTHSLAQDLPHPAGWTSPWMADDAWRAQGPSVRHAWWQGLSADGSPPGAPSLLRVSRQGQVLSVQALRPRASDAVHITLPSPQATRSAQALAQSLRIDHHQAVHLHLYTHAEPQGLLVDVFTAAGHAQGRLLTPEQIGRAGVGASTADTVPAPMPGRVLKVLVQTGDKVQAGQALMVLEAMKMEHTLCAPRDGRVMTCLCATGDQVSEGATLLQLAPASPKPGAGAEAAAATQQAQSSPTLATPD